MRAANLKTVKRAMEHSVEAIGETRVGFHMGEESKIDLS